MAHDALFASAAGVAERRASLSVPLPPTAFRKPSHKAGLGHWSDAIEQYQRILETSGDELIPVPAPVAPLSQIVGGTAYTIPWTSPNSVAARWICHEQIGTFPPAALKLYRDRTDAVAAKRLGTARTRADDRPLQSILQDWFNSRPAEEAILLLAQRAFERADFDLAARYWRMLLPDVREDLHFPDPKTPAATVRANLILTTMFRGDIEQARLDLKAYPRGLSRGLWLAGRDGMGNMPTPSKRFSRILRRRLFHPRPTTARSGLPSADDRRAIR